MQTSANPSTIQLTPDNFKKIYHIVSKNPAYAELKEHLRKYFLHLLKPEAHDELTEIEKRALLLGLEVLLIISSFDKEPQKIIAALKQDIEHEGALFLAIIKDDEKQAFIDYIHFYDPQEQNHFVMRAGRAVNEELGVANPEDQQLNYLVYRLHLEGLRDLGNGNIQTALRCFTNAYRRALKISDVNKEMRDSHIAYLKTSVVHALKAKVKLSRNKGEEFANKRLFGKAMVAYANAVKVATIVYNATNDAELLVENQRLLVDASIGKGECETALKKYDNAILYYRAALGAHRKVLSEFQSEYNLNYPLLVIHSNLANCYLEKANAASNQKDEIKYYLCVINSYHAAMKANKCMPRQFQNEDQSLLQLTLLREKCANALFNLGAILHAHAINKFNAKKYEDAKKIFDNAITFFEAVPADIQYPGVRHLLAESLSYVIQIQQSMGKHFYNCEMYEDALEYFEDALKYAEKIPGEELDEERVAKISRCRQKSGDCHEHLGTNHLAQKHYREALVYLILEYYYRYTPAQERNNSIERQNQLKTCAVKLSKAWSSLFPPKEGKCEDAKKVAPQQEYRQAK